VEAPEVGGRRKHLGLKVNQVRIQLLQLSQQLVEVEVLETICPQVSMEDLVPVDVQANLAEPLAKQITQIGKSMETRVLLEFLVLVVGVEVELLLREVQEMVVTV
jgi:hypothetical protein